MALCLPLPWACIPPTSLTEIPGEPQLVLPSIPGRAPSAKPSCLPSSFSSFLQSASCFPVPRSPGVSHSQCASPRLWVHPHREDPLTTSWGPTGHQGLSSLCPCCFPLAQPSLPKRTPFPSRWHLVRALSGSVCLSLFSLTLLAR